MNSPTSTHPRRRRWSSRSHSGRRGGTTVRFSRVVLAAVASVALALPAAAGAQSTTSNPFSEPLPQPTVSTTTTAAPTVSTSATAGGGSAFSGNSAIIIAIGAALVLGGIALFIWRDARKHAPVRHRTAAVEAGTGRQGSKQRTKPRKLSPAEKRRRKRGRAR
jgi:hypothetical protein